MPTYLESPLWVFFTTLCLLLNFLCAHRNTGSHIPAASLQSHSSTRSPKESSDSTNQSCCLQINHLATQTGFSAGYMKNQGFFWPHSWPWPNLSKEPTEINKTFINCTLSAVNLPGNPPQQLIISKLTHCAAEQFSLAFQKWTDYSSLAPGDVSTALQNFFLETPF